MLVTDLIAVLPAALQVDDMGPIDGSLYTICPPTERYAVGLKPSFNLDL